MRSESSKSEFLSVCFTTCHTSCSVTPSPHHFPARHTHRNSFPEESPASAVQASAIDLTQSGIGTVRMWPPLPTRSTIAQCSSRRCKCANVRSANSRRRSPHPSNTARIAQSRLPFSVVGSGACQRQGSQIQARSIRNRYSAVLCGEIGGFELRSLISRGPSARADQVR
jgi:hypothetical protein